MYERKKLMDYKKIPVGKDSPETVNCVIEIPRDTNQKYEFDDEIKAFRLDRILNSAMRYPANYGFIPSTLGEDGDPLDMLTYNWTPMAMGCVVRCHVIGVLEMEDGGEMDWKLIGRPTTSYKKSVVDIHNINAPFLAQAKNFFQHYKDLDGKKVKIGEWLPRDKAIDIVKESIKRYNDNKNI